MTKHLTTHPRPTTIDMSQAAKRTCLKCRVVFTSLGSSNRICPGCQEDNRSVGRRVERGGARSKSGNVGTGEQS